MKERKDKRRRRYGHTCARRPAPDAQQETTEAHFFKKGNRQASRGESCGQIRTRRAADDPRTVEAHKERHSHSQQPYAGRSPKERRAPRRRTENKQFAHRTPLDEPPQQRSYEQNAYSAERRHYKHGPLGHGHIIAQRHRGDCRYPQQGKSHSEPACDSALLQYIPEVHKCLKVVLRPPKIVKGGRRSKRIHAFLPARPGGKTPAGNNRPDGRDGSSDRIYRSADRNACHCDRRTCHCHGKSRRENHTGQHGIMPSSRGCEAHLTHPAQSAGGFPASSTYCSRRKMLLEYFQTP